MSQKKITSTFTNKCHAKIIRKTKRKKVDSLSQLLTVCSVLFFCFLWVQ